MLNIVRNNKKKNTKSFCRSFGATLVLNPHAPDFRLRSDFFFLNPFDQNAGDKTDFEKLFQTDHRCRIYSKIAIKDRTRQYQFHELNT